MLNIERFKIYLEKINFGSIGNYISYLNMLKTILNKIDEYSELNDEQKVIKFASTKNDFNSSLNNFLSKFRITAREWDIEFWNNKIIKQKDIRCLKKGQSKFNLLITGQIHHHSSKGNKQSNLLTELMKPQYVKRIGATRNGMGERVKGIRRTRGLGVCGESRGDPVELHTLFE